MGQSPFIERFDPVLEYGNKLVHMGGLENFEQKLREAAEVELAACLTGAYFNLKPAGLIAVELEPAGKARLLWSANPAEMAGV